MYAPTDIKFLSTDSNNNACAVYFLIPPYLSNMTAIMVASPINAFENPIQLLAYIDFHSFYFLFPMPYQKYLQTQSPDDDF